MTADDEMVAFRLAANDRKTIRRLVDAGEFRNRSDFFRYAVKATLASYGSRLPDLDIEGVELPAHTPARAAHGKNARDRRSNRG